MRQGAVQLPEDLVQVLGLDRQDDQLGVADCATVVVHRGYAVALAEVVAAGGDRLADAYVIALGQAGGQRSFEDGFGHNASANK